MKTARTDIRVRLFKSVNVSEFLAGLNNLMRLSAQEYFIA
jgi:hypothetical protein